MVKIPVKLRLSLDMLKMYMYVYDLGVRGKSGHVIGPVLFENDRIKFQEFCTCSNVGCTVVPIEDCTCGYYTRTSDFLYKPLDLKILNQCVTGCGSTTTDLVEESTIKTMLNDCLDSLLNPVEWPPTFEIVNITGEGTHDASILDVTYNFAPGTYTYNINGFGVNDKLNFPPGNEPTIINTDFAEGELIVQWAYNGDVIQVNITGISPEIDATITGANSFRNAFGISSINLN